MAVDNLKRAIGSSPAYWWARILGEFTYERVALPAAVAVDVARFPDDDISDVERAERTLWTGVDIISVATLVTGVGGAISAGRVALSGAASVARTAATSAGRQALRQSAKRAVVSSVDGAVGSARGAVASARRAWLAADDGLTTFQRLNNAPLGATSGAKVTNLMVKEAWDASRVATTSARNAWQTARRAAINERHWRLLEVDGIRLAAQAQGTVLSGRVASHGASVASSARAATAGARAARANAQAASAAASRSVANARNLTGVRRAQQAAGYQGPAAAARVIDSTTTAKEISVGAAVLLGGGFVAGGNLRFPTGGSSGRGSITGACVQR